MLFRPEHIELIKQDKKWQTRRVWEKNRARAGAIHKMQTRLFGATEGHILILKVWKEPLTYVDHKAEGYATRKDFKDVWRKIHRRWVYNQIVTVVEFVFVDPKTAHYIKAGNTGKRIARQAQQLIREHRADFVRKCYE